MSFEGWFREFGELNERLFSRIGVNCVVSRLWTLGDFALPIDLAQDR